MKHIKEFGQFISESQYHLEEGLMSDVHRLIHDAKNVQEFVKRFFAE